MKKQIAYLAFALFLLPLSGMAQVKQGIGIHFGGYDFYGPQTDKYFFTDRYTYKYNDEKAGFDSSLKKKLYWKPFVKFTYWWEMSKHLDLNLGLSLASLEYPMSRPDSAYINKYYYDEVGEKDERLLIELDARVNYNILAREDYCISPYLFAGISSSFHHPYFGANIPLGVGAHINLTRRKDVTLNLETGYRVAATDHDQNHLQHSLGFVYWFKPGYKPTKEKQPDLADLLPPSDVDNDGVVDSIDACPSVAGLEQFNGCPDSDNDGVADDKDACPLVAGKAEFSGCPDSDGDGINDKDDKCPYVAGTTDHDGCPIPDRDNDGFNDSEDRCPDQYSKTNGGCPEIRKEVINKVQKAAKAIFFETGKATIRKVSYKQLDAVAAVLKDDPTLYADIEGHTDNTGSDERNTELSQQRAEAVVNYLVGKGIPADRLTAKGYGPTQPVATNATAAGRAQNRRTEIELRNFRK